ncbi:FtsX-like permease family protein [Streptomyces sp. NPDC048106]|uniref:FtsX-like permease family protein n=1 Tax=Streptomyces sp. NPDC048106 TaxID=3155750 RepID=UPI003454FC5A
MTGFVFARARAHRLLLGAALLTVVLTTTVLATLTAYAGAIGDAAVRHALADPGTAADAALIVKADVPPDERAAADRAVREEAGRAFDGLPLTVRTLRRSGPYALPASLRPPAHRSGDPDLTYLAALDRTRLRLTEGRSPRPAGSGGTIEVALPGTAARLLRLRPGDRLTLPDRLGGPALRVRISGLYRPVSATAPYWRLDDLLGRGVKESGFTTYGPLLADPSVFTGGRVSAGTTAWLASADFAGMTTGRIGRLRTAARAGGTALRARAELHGATTVRTGLPEALDRIDRSLLVARSTLLIAALQLVVLAGYALLRVARLLGSERAAETGLLRARGASGARLALLAAAEALLLVLPAAVLAPLLSTPLARVLAAHGPLSRLGLHLTLPVTGRPAVWLVAVVVSSGCAVAMAVMGGGARAVAPRRARSGALPASVRAGADLALLAVAAVAYAESRREGAGGVAADRSGALGVDPLLVAAPALALLAGTVLTLRLLPSVARPAERWAARGRGLSMALAALRFSRRTARGAGPVPLLVLTVALGVLALGQAASWHRSQDDQADFRAGAPVRLTAAGAGGLGSTDGYARLPHVRAAAPAFRAEQPLSGDRTATVLALDTRRAADAVLLRPDLADTPTRPLLARVASDGSPAGTRVPAGTAGLRLTATLGSSAGPGLDTDVTVTLTDAYGVSYRMPFGQLPADGRPHTLRLDVSAARGALTLTGLQLELIQPPARARHRLVLSGLTATGADGRAHGLALPARWTTAADAGGDAVPNSATSPTRPRLAGTRPPTFTYGTGYLPAADEWRVASVTIRLQVPQPAPAAIPALVTDRYLASADARPGQRVDLMLAGHPVPIRIVRAVRALPTTGDDGGAVLLDLRALNRFLQSRYGDGAPPTEWWLATGDARHVASALRALPDIDPAQVVVRDEIAARLRDDPFGAGPAAACTATAVAAAVLAALGFAVGAAATRRAREAESAVLHALGAPRRRLTRAVAAEQTVLVALALGLGLALGTAVAHAVLPLITLTADATRPAPPLLVRLPLLQVGLLLVAVAALPLALTALPALRRPDPNLVLRTPGGE